MRKNTSPPSSTQGLSRLISFAVYYGSGQLDVLSRYQLVILQGDKWTPEGISHLRSRNTVPLAYISLSEDVAWRPDSGWYIADERGQPRCNDDWRSYLVDVSNEAWRQHILDEANKWRNQGFAGLFLDTVDGAAVSDPEGRATVALIENLKRVWPHALLVVNRGFDILDQVKEVIDGVLFESFTAHQDVSGIRTWDGSDFLWVTGVANRLQKLGVPVFTLDYANPGSDLAEICQRHAREWGFVPYVTPDLHTLAAKSP